MNNSIMIKNFNVLLLLTSVLFASLLLSCIDTEDDTDKYNHTLTVNVAIPGDPVTGTLYCNVYKQHDFSAKPDWSNSKKLQAESGIISIAIEFDTDELLVKEVYLAVWLDENSNQIPDDNEYLEYYGNLASIDLAERTSTPLELDSDGSTVADMILDKRINDEATPAPVGLEVNVYYEDGIVGNYLFFLVFAKDCSCYLDKGVCEFVKQPPVQITETYTFIQFLETDLSLETIISCNITEVYFLIEEQSDNTYGPPQSGLYYEYYNNKNINDSQNKIINTVPVNSSMDIILNIKG